MNVPQSMLFSFVVIMLIALHMLPTPDTPFCPLTVPSHRSLSHRFPLALSTTGSRCTRCGHSIPSSYAWR